MTASDGNRVPEASLVHRGLGRVEFFDLTDAQVDGLDTLLRPLADEGRDRLSFHAPVHRPDWFPEVGVTCYFLCEDAERRETSFRLLDHTLALGRRWGADYVVTHLTFGKTDTRDADRAAELAVEATARMAAMSRAHGLPIDLEFAAYTDSFHDPEAFAAAVAGHPELGVCIDVGHTCLGAMQRGRDLLDDVAALAPQVRSTHLWNTLGPEHTAEHHHTPLHPDQDPRDGWIDIEAALGLMLDHRPDLNIIFEYPVDAVTPEIQAGYDWVASLAGRAS